MVGASLFLQALLWCLPFLENVPHTMDFCVLGGNMLPGTIYLTPSRDVGSTSPAALQPVAWQEDSGGFWRTPVFPAGPLAWGPWSLRTLCIMRTPFVLAEQPRREWASQGPPCLTAWDCLRKRLGQHSQQLDTGKASPSHPGLHPGLQRETWHVFLSVVFQALWWVCTPVTRPSSMEGGLCLLLFIVFAVLEWMNGGWQTLSSSSRIWHFSWNFKPTEKTEASLVVHW